MPQLELPQFYAWSLVFLAVVLLVLAYHNVRTLKISNLSNGLILAAGIAACAVRASLATNPADEIFYYFWPAAAIVLIGLAVVGLSAGLGKLLIALLPWLRPDDFLWAAGIAIGVQVIVSIYSVSMGRNRRNTKLMVPVVPAVLIGVAAMAAKAWMTAYGA